MAWSKNCLFADEPEKAKIGLFALFNSKNLVTMTMRLEKSLNSSKAINYEGCSFVGLSRLLTNDFFCLQDYSLSSLQTPDDEEDDEEKEKEKKEKKKEKDGDKKKDGDKDKDKKAGEGDKKDKKDKEEKKK